MAGAELRHADSDRLRLDVRQTGADATDFARTPGSFKVTSTRVSSHRVKVDLACTGMGNVLNRRCPRTESLITENWTRSILRREGTGLDEYAPERTNPPSMFRMMNDLTSGISLDTSPMWEPSDVALAS